MRQLFTLMPALLFFCFVEGQPKKPLEIEVFSQGGERSMAFTSNRFNAINISKDGVVWAGTVYEGLYRLDTKSSDTNNIWTKSTVAPNLFINDIKPDRFGGIWVAQSGNRSPGGSNIQGGVYHVPDAKRDSSVFYSMSGTQTEGYFYSRNLVSLFITDSNRTFPTSSPESIIFAAQGLSRSGGDIIRGGFNKHKIGFELVTDFQRIAGRTFTPTIINGYEPSGWDWRRKSPMSNEQLSKPYAECVGGSSTGEVWVGVRDNYDMTEIVRYSPDGTPKGKEASYNHTNSPLSQYSQPRAIKIDRYDNKWITTRNDGIIVLGSTGWKQMKFAGLLPAGTVFNRNAIAEDAWGNMYFGTSAGLLVYRTEMYDINSGPGDSAAYDLYTTEDSLPGNNITGLAYDEINGKILMATDGGGVAFLNVKPDHIEGVVFDVYTGILNKETATSTDFKKIPISNRAYIRLFEGEFLNEVVEPDEKGYFKFSHDLPGKKNYRVEVEYTTKDNNSMKYIYPDIESQSKVPPVLFPDSLIREIKKFKDSLLKRCIDIKILTFIPYKHCYDGFFTTNYEEPFSQFTYPSEINADHKRKVDNLGIYLASLKTVYDLGGNANQLVVQSMDNGWALLKSLKSMFDLTKSLKEAPIGVTADSVLLGKMMDALILTVKASKEAFVESLKFASVILATNSKAQPLIKLITGNINDVFDAAMGYFEKYRAFTGSRESAYDKFGILMEALDLVAKIVTEETGAYYYKEMYARGVHERIVPQASYGSVQSKSDLTYNQANFSLVASNGESLLSKGSESLEFYQGVVADLNKLSKGAEMLSKATELFQVLVVVPGGQPVAVAAAAFAKSAKLVEVAANAGAIVTDAVGANEQEDISKKILNKSGINGIEASNQARKINRVFRIDSVSPSQQQPVELLNSKNNYNEKVSAIQALAGASSFTGEDYTNRLKELTKADSAYSRETKNVLEKLMASADSAMIYIPEFEGNLRYMMDSFVNRQAMYKYSFFMNQLALLTDVGNKADYFPALDSTAKELKELNDSIYNNLVRMINLINNNGIGAPAYLSQSDYVLNHDFVPGTPGTFTNTYTNYGTEEMRRVSFKINQPTEGFNITSADSVYVGNIAPGASVQVSFNFSSPLHTDSITIGRYEIDIKADNGKYRNTTGNLLIIQQSALPVTLVSFEANCSGSNTELTWETASESNSSHFEIEKSMNGVDWIASGSVTAAGNSSVRRLYKLEDQSSKNSFYRLKQIDKDGKFAYSNVIRSKCGIERPMILLYPIPTDNILNVAINVSENSTAKVLLIDLAGKVIQQFDTDLKKGANHLQLNVKGMAAGQYLLNIKGSKISKTQKVTIGR